MNARDQVEAIAEDIVSRCGPYDANTYEKVLVAVKLAVKEAATVFLDMPSTTDIRITDARREASLAMREQCAKVADDEATACLGDIVPGDDMGARMAGARAGALIDHAERIRALSPDLPAGTKKDAP